MIRQMEEERFRIEEEEEEKEEMIRQMEEERLRIEELEAEVEAIEFERIQLAESLRIQLLEEGTARKEAESSRQKELEIVLFQASHSGEIARLVEEVNASKIASECSESLRLKQEDLLRFTTAAAQRCLQLERENANKFKCEAETAR